MSREHLTESPGSLHYRDRERMAGNLLKRAKTTGELQEGLALILGSVPASLAERFGHIPPGDRLPEAVERAAEIRVKKSRGTVSGVTK